MISVNTDGIEVVSHYVSNTSVRFGTNQSTTSTISENNSNVIAYSRYIKTLNTIAAQYTDGVHVKATRHMGYNSDLSTEEIIDKTSLILKIEPWNGSTGKSGLTREDMGGGDLGYNIDYNKVVSVYGSSNKAKANKVGTSTSTSYWLASRNYTYYDSTHWRFGGRFVHNFAGDFTSAGMYHYNSSSFSFESNSLPVRPILTLKPDVVVSGGKGTSEKPYILA